MKERIVFKTESSIKGRKEIAKINEYVNNFNFDCAFERKVEQVPETWKELRSLCIKLSTKENMIYIFNEWKNPNKEFLKIRTLRFYPDGTIRNDYEDKNNEPYIIAENRTPAQMWNIIKALVDKNED